MPHTPTHLWLCIVGILTGGLISFCVERAFT